MFNLLPRDTVFFDLFEGMAQHAINSAKYLQQLAQSFPDIDQSIQRIRGEEHLADQLAHQRPILHSYKTGTLSDICDCARDRSR